MMFMTYLCLMSFAQCSESSIIIAEKGLKSSYMLPDSAFIRGVVMRPFKIILNQLWVNNWWLSCMALAGLCRVDYRISNWKYFLIYTYSYMWVVDYNFYIFEIILVFWENINVKLFCTKEEIICPGHSNVWSLDHCVLKTFRAAAASTRLSISLFSLIAHL